MSKKEDSQQFFVFVAANLNAVQCEGHIALVIKPKLIKGYGNHTSAHREVSAHTKQT